MKTVPHMIDDGAGYRLAAFQTWDEGRLDVERRPVVILPGYGMNSFIFSYHPNGTSLVGYLAERGLEVWRADLRGQGESVRDGGTLDYSLEDLARVDVGAVIREVLATTKTRRTDVLVVGCSLGGTLMFLHAALVADHAIAGMVAMGSPVRWVDVHPLIRALAGMPRVVNALPMKGARRLAEVALPVLAKRTPWVLSAYMNPEIVDTSAAKHFAKTVEDPNRSINREIMRWVRERDLFVGGVDLSESVRRSTLPILCIAANGDGIVPTRTAVWPAEVSAADDKTAIEVGTRDVWMAHADMFVSRECHERVFRPLGDWLVSH